MAVRKLSIALDESVAAEAASAAARHGVVSLSAWLDAAPRRSRLLEAGLDAVRDWEQEHGELSFDELAWADRVLDTISSQEAR